MAEQGEDVSDGSDIEAEYEVDDGDIDVLDGNIDHEVIQGDVDEWIRNIFNEENDVNDEFLGFQNEWVQDNFQPRMENNYRKVVGATIEHPEEASPGQYFELFWTNEIIDRLVNETNLYARQEREKNPPPPYAAKWTLVTSSHLRAFLGLCFGMGILHLPEKRLLEAE